MTRRFTRIQHARPSRAGQPHRPVAGRPGLLFTLVLVVVSLGSCSRLEPERTPALPPTAIAALRPTWAVVTDSYVRLHTEPSADAPIVGHLRRADVASITAISANGVRIGARRHHWYLFEHETVRGWALDRHVDPFGSESRARNAAMRLLEPDP